MALDPFQKGMLTGALAVAALMAWRPELAVKLADGAHTARVWIADRASDAQKARSGGAKRPPAGLKELGLRARLVAGALRERGARYQYGGNTPATGFDCSGLVEYVYHQDGIRLPRTAADQRDAVKAVDPSDLRPGDLCFFLVVHDSGVGKGLSQALRWVGWPPDHVAIYLGAGRMIHAPRTGKQVEIASVKDPFWQSRFVGAGSPI